MPLVTKKPFWAFTFLLIVCISEWGCRAQDKAPEPPASPDTLFAFKLGNAYLQVQLALTDEERNLGLMHRKTLPHHQGMLFVFDRPQQLNFWMKNTHIPLDIAYIDSEGIIREIYPLHPHDLTSISSQRKDLQFALEVPRGWFKQNKVHTGAHLDLITLSQALQTRGLNPSHIGLRTLD